MSNPSITADKTPWYQWGTGLTVTVSGGAISVPIDAAVCPCCKPSRIFYLRRAE